ncbi:MAG: UTP--glucose-1-phosphate uridylyltransferase [Candidatus Doudnabacteria bacterium]|nr:UTP--glucose-1-phosphate uridylyltransferase [Candidatus Doudnabacteria bacterium]
MANTKKVRKAIIPAAGFGTRFLPATKAQPKEMLPIVDKPVIQYVVEDAVSAGIEDIIIVTGWSKRNIEDHFDYPFELEKRLQDTGKLKELEEIRRIADLASFTYLRQKGPLGNATAILNAKHLIGNEPFMVLWGDDFMDATPTRSQQLVAAFEKLNGSAVLSAIRAGREEDYKRYGYATGTKVDDTVLKIDKVIEKPGKNIGSDLAIVGGAVYGPEMFEALDEAYKRWQKEKRGEFVYIDALDVLLENKKACYALEIQNAKWYDCGDKLEYLKAVVEFGLKHKDLNGEFAKYLKNIVQ